MNPLDVIALIAILYSGYFGYYLARKVLELYEMPIDKVLNKKVPLPSVGFFQLFLLWVAIIYVLIYGVERFSEIVIMRISNVSGNAIVFVYLGPLIVAAIVAYFAYIVTIYLNDPLKYVYNNLRHYFKAYFKEAVRSESVIKRIARILGGDQERIDRCLKILREIEREIDSVVIVRLTIYTIAIRISLIIAGEIELVTDFEEHVKNSINSTLGFLAGRRIYRTYREQVADKDFVDYLSFEQVLEYLSLKLTYYLLDYVLVAYETIKKILSRKNVIIFRPLSMISKKIRVSAKPPSIENS